MNKGSFDPTQYTKSAWLKGEDLDPGERTIATISAAYEHTFQQSGDVQPVLEFEELNQNLTLNKTRIRKLIELFGANPEQWIGQRVSLYAVDVQFGGKTVLSVAIGPAPSKPRPVDDVVFTQDEDDSEEMPF